MNKQLNKTDWNNTVVENYSKIKPTLFFLPILLIGIIFVLLWTNDALTVEKYVSIQKNCFYYLNLKLSYFPSLAMNLTQFGDAMIFLSIISIFLLYAPKIWEALLTASIFSAVFSTVLKEIFLVPRPAAAFNNNSFVIIGKALPGYSSLPSGHSITVFTVLSVLMFAFCPKAMKKQALWFFTITIIGLVLVFTRVAVGAHFPLDVIIGGIIGYISGLLGIFINQKYSIWKWINNKKYYPVFILLFFVGSILIFIRILNENLIVYYLSLLCLILSIFKIFKVYVQK
jgi:membrane-associated phospholipid phosphatase